MAAGRPTVVNTIGDVERLVREDNIGLLAKPDMSDFAEKIILLLKNPDLAQSLGHNARKAAAECFDEMLEPGIIAENISKMLAKGSGPDSVGR